MLTLPRHWFLGFLFLLILAVAGFYYFRSRTARQTLLTTSPTTPTSNPTPAEAQVEALSGIEAPEPSPIITPQPTSPSPSLPSFVGAVKLIIPVEGVTPDQLRDTFTEARSEGRTHDAIDIMAPAGAPVMAAADGSVVKLFVSERGGLTIYQVTVDQRLILYYAHLQRYANGLIEGKAVRQGEVIGYVGDSGNAGAGNFHLHFSIAVVADPKRYWEGTNINPYPLLRNPVLQNP